MAENSPEELEGTNEEEELNSINPLNEEDAPEIGRASCRERV